MLIDVDNIEILNATFPNLTSRNLIMVDYSDINGERKSMVIGSDDDSDFGLKVFDKFNLSTIENNTKLLHEENKKQAKNFLQFLEWKESGLIKTIDDDEEKIIEEKISEIQPQEITLDFLENLDNENLFKLKLSIFDIEEFQDIDDRELRSQVRKSKNLPELMHYYHIFKINQNSNN